MKKTFLGILIMFLPTFVNAGSQYYNIGAGPNVSEEILKAWGAPTIAPGYIQDRNGPEASKFKIKSGWACCGSVTAGTKNKAIISILDDEAYMALLAQKNISEHGAEFCLTQVAAASSFDVFYIEFQQPNWPGMQCAWFCEPGWDGPECKEKTSPEHACNSTNYIEEIKRVQKDIYDGNDAITLHGHRPGVANNIAVLASRYPDPWRYPHQIVLGAIDFKEHGIVVTPMLLGSVGNHPVTTWVTAQKATGGVTKTLCAQGYTNGEDCKMSSTRCGVDTFCTGHSGKYNKSIHAKRPNGMCSVVACKDESKALDVNFNCIDCEPDVRQGRCNVVGLDTLGQCIKCDTGLYFDDTDCTCKPVRMTLTKQQMKFGAFEGDLPAKQCWAMTDMEKIKKCLQSVMPESTETTVITTTTTTTTESK